MCSVSAPSPLAAGCICQFSKQPHHRPDFCLNRKQSVVQWKGPGSKHCLNPVWFGDKLKSAEGQIKGKEWKRAELPAISPPITLWLYYGNIWPNYTTTASLCDQGALLVWSTLLQRWRAPHSPLMPHFHIDLWANRNVFPHMESYVIADVYVIRLLKQQYSTFLP